MTDSVERAPYWRKMPCSWQTDPDFYSKLKQYPEGVAIAALKLYIGLCLKANFNEKENLPAKGCIRHTIDQLARLVDMSRPMVIKGMRALKELDVIEVVKARPAIYRIKQYETARYWTKLPSEHLFERERDTTELDLTVINRMGNRGRVVLHALELYLYVAAIRNKDTDRAMVSYTQISEVLGIQRNSVSIAISALIHHDLISHRKAEASRPGELPCNVYWLRGTANDPMRGELARHLAEQRQRMANSFSPMIDLD